jgi:hypothetical protein
LDQSACAKARFRHISDTAAPVLPSACATPRITRRLRCQHISTSIEDSTQPIDNSDCSSSGQNTILNCRFINPID